ncbi:MAG: hypothetical protein GY929_09725, partial [Actinomycetia bacterium]|nr:hypothetical protein [Actinomycetes bacterium]
MKLRGRRFHQLIAGASILAACSSTPEGAAPDAVPSTASSTALATIRSAPTSPATDGPTTTSVAVPALPATPVQCRAVAVSDSEPTLADPQLNELSGLAVGRLDSSILWAVDDDADPPAVHGLAADGTTISRIELHGVTGGDWEDLAAGPGPDGDPTPHLYVADIGDNKGQRDNIRVFRFPEPGPASTGVAPDTIT